MSVAYKILAQSLIPNAVTTIYTVPAGKQAIIKHISVVNPAGSGAVNLTLYQNGTGAVNQILPATSIPDGGYTESEATRTMNAGETLRALGSVNNALSITVYGAEVA